MLLKALHVIYLCLRMYIQVVDTRKVMNNVYCTPAVYFFLNLQFPKADVVGCRGAGESWRLSFTKVR